MGSPFINLLSTTLDDGRNAVVTAVDGLSEAAAHAKPGNGWSALDVLEHLTIVEGRFVGWIEKGERYDAAQVDHQKEGRLTGMMLDRSTKVQAPDPVHPTGRFQTLAAAIEAFTAAREATKQVVAERGDDLYLVKAAHPRFGEINGVELLNLLAAHSRRHADQIRELREALGC
jgi:hypothetical protein